MKEIITEDIGEPWFTYFIEEIKKEVIYIRQDLGSDGPVIKRKKLNDHLNNIEIVCNKLID